MLIDGAIGRTPGVDVDHRMAGGVGEVEIVVHLDTFGIAWTVIAERGRWRPVPQPIRGHVSERR